MPSIPEEVIVRPFSWVNMDTAELDPELDDNIDNYHKIHCWAKDRKSNTVLLKIRIPIYIYIELPVYVLEQGHQKRVNWSQYYDIFCDHVGEILKEDKPFKTSFVAKEKLYYFQGGRKHPMILACFHTMEAMRHAQKLLEKPQTIKKMGATILCKVHEYDIAPITKFLAVNQVKYAQWFRVPAVPVHGANKISKDKCLEYVVKDWSLIEGISEEESTGWNFDIRVMSFDIESCPKNHKKFPNPSLISDPSYLITCVTQVIGKRETTRTSKAILFGESMDIDGYIIVRVQDEVSMIMEFCKEIDEQDPDVITGYNIYRYDWRCLDTKLGLRLKNWPNVSRLKNANPKLFSKEWESAAYGKQNISYLDMEGRLVIDLYTIIKRDYKDLKTYSLGAVSMKFLKRTKKDLKMQEQFRRYGEYQAISKLLRDKYNCKTYNQALDLPDLPEELRQRIITNLLEMKEVLEYGLLDSELVLDLFDERLNIWYALLEQSSINGVSIITLVTGGQQQRCISLIYAECVKDGIVMDKRITEKVHVKGAYVADPLVGLHDCVNCLDFASLYPSIIQECNIDYRSFVPASEADRVGDEECNVIEWTEDPNEDVKGSKKIVEEEDIDEDDYKMGAVRAYVTNKDKEEIEDLVNEALEEEDKAEVAKTAKTVKKKLPLIHYRNRFHKKAKTIIPRIVAYLVAERRKVKKIIEITTDPVQKVILTSRELALKYTANSFYGFITIQNGAKYPLIEGGMSTTARGRYLISVVNFYIKARHTIKNIMETTGREINDVTYDLFSQAEVRSNIIYYRGTNDLFPIHEEDKDTLIVYNDTDSSMFKTSNQDPKQCHEQGKIIEAEINGNATKKGLFRDPVKIESEKEMKIILIGKKQYLYYLIDPKTGEYKKEELKKKGVTSARRDNAGHVAKLYDTLAANCLNDADFRANLQLLFQHLGDLMEDRLPLNLLSIVKELNSNYKQANNSMKVFSDGLKNEGKPVMAGERLEYLIRYVAGEKLLGKRMILLDDFNPEVHKIDKAYYLEHNYMNPIHKLLGAAHKREMEEKYQGIGYKPLGRFHFIPIALPVKILARMFNEGKDYSTIKQWFFDVFEPKPVKKIIKLNIKPIVIETEEPSVKTIKLRITKPIVNTIKVNGNTMEVIE